MKSAAGSGIHESVPPRHQEPFRVSPQAAAPVERERRSSLPPSLVAQRDRLEDLILTFASDSSWEQLTLAACNIYPELREDFMRLHPQAVQPISNRIRASRERYRLREFVVDAALLDYREYPAF